MDMALLRDVILQHKHGDKEGALGAMEELVNAVLNGTENVINNNLAVLLLGTQLQLLAAQRADEQARKDHLQCADVYLLYAMDEGPNCLAVHGMRAAVHWENHRMKEADMAIADALTLHLPDDPIGLRVHLPDHYIYIGDVSNMEFTGPDIEV